MREPARLRIEDLAKAITDRAAGRPRVLVGIDGPGASGKSTLAGLVAGRLNRAAVVHVDDFYLPRELHGTRAGEVGPLFDLPRLAAQVVLPAARGAAVRYQRYDWDSDAPAEWVEVPADVPVVVEGVYSLAGILRDAYTYTVFCCCDSAIRLRRGLDRDGQDAESMWLDEWMPAEDAYVAAERPDDFADLVVDSTKGAGSAEVRFDVQRWQD